MLEVSGQSVGPPKDQAAEELSWSAYMKHHTNRLDAEMKEHRTQGGAYDSEPIDKATSIYTLSGTPYWAPYSMLGNSAHRSRLPFKAPK